MDKKKTLLIAGVCVLAAVIAGVLLMSGGAEEPAGPPGMTTRPTDGTTLPPAQSLPSETTAPETTAPETTRPPETMLEETGPEQTTPHQTEPGGTEPPVYNTVQFPVELEGGMLTVQSLFQFSGMNPDAQNAEGENIAGVQFTNTSDRHMAYAEVTAVLADGTEMTFRAADVPAGKTVMAFSVGNETVANVDACEEVQGWAEFETGDPMRSDLVSVSVSGMEVTVTNVSGKDLTNLDVSCHSVLDESYFGGVTYCYRIESLPAGGSTTVYAWDCILGLAEVVRVDAGG